MSKSGDIRFTVFRIADEKITCDSDVPDTLRRMAEATFNVLFDAQIFAIPRIEQMVFISLAILAGEQAGTYPRQGYYQDEDSEAKKIFDVLSLLVDGKHPWQSMLANGEMLRECDMLAAYALYQLDKAASCHRANDSTSAMEHLALAYEATAFAEYGYGYYARTSDHRIEGWFGAKNSQASQVSRTLRQYAIQRYEEGRANGTPWKSPRECAINIEAAVIAESERLGCPLKRDKNVWRTIYGWYAEAGLRKRKNVQ